MGHYQRKIRGIDDLDDSHNEKFSFCCSKCRHRVNPISLRFFFRIIFGSSFFILISALMNDNKFDLKLAAKKFGIDIKTLKRWKCWWDKEFPSTGLYRQLQGHFLDTINTAPQYFFEHFQKEKNINDSIISILKLFLNSS